MMRHQALGRSLILLLAAGVTACAPLASDHPFAPQEKAPDFKLVDVADRLISPEQYQGKKLMLVFYFGHG